MSDPHAAAVPARQSGGLPPRRHRTSRPRGRLFDAGEMSGRVEGCWLRAWSALSVGCFLRRGFGFDSEQPTPFQLEPSLSGTPSPVAGSDGRGIRKQPSRLFLRGPGREPGVFGVIGVQEGFLPVEDRWVLAVGVVEALLANLHRFRRKHEVVITVLSAGP